MIKIYEKYIDNIHPFKWRWWYINISIIKDLINDVCMNWYTICGYEFLKITEKSTQPFMEYSIRREGGYTNNELIEEINKLEKNIFKKGFKKEEIYFALLINNK